ncbi:hypothetical protein SpCBS45565_g05374 [Spizellomyces sp. 'palustris']|nr:hypothetical protein SpCBS45565_g05374 [Spizellomyces sp. 'palustris']
MTVPRFAELQSTVQALDEDAVTCVHESGGATNKAAQDVIDLSGPSTAPLVRKRKALPQLNQPQKGRRQKLPPTKPKSPPGSGLPMPLRPASDDEDESLYTSDNLDAKDRKRKGASRCSLPQLKQPQKGRRQKLPETKPKSPPGSGLPMPLQPASDDEDESLYTSDDLDAKDRKRKGTSKKQKLSKKQNTKSSLNQPGKHPSDPIHWTPEMERWLCDGYIEYQASPKRIHAKVARYIMDHMPKVRGGGRLRKKHGARKCKRPIPSWRR